ncbi:hypothetical protein AB0L97_33050 [Nocardia sp. NPDC051911]|uniref:hypothetical protein n=1 Tax=Nocardia sp. NPDC051911 TaxID=3154648 RepID=UPI00341A761B
MSAPTAAARHLDGATWHAHATIYKFHPDKAIAAVERFGHEPTLAELLGGGWEPDEITEVDGNLLTTVGLTRLTSLFTGAGGTAFDNTHGFIGVGTSTTAALVGDTALGSNGTSNAWYRPLDASYPTTSGGAISANCTFGGSDANFAWNEWGSGISNSTSPTPANAIASVGTSPILVNHKIQTMGTKASPAIWGVLATITIA